MKKRRVRETVLALGAESKGVYALQKGRRLIVSRDFGDLADYDNFSRFEKAVKRELKRSSPGIIVSDMHPGYNSTDLAEEIMPDSARLFKVQHHHAHIASCMRDNDLKGRVIGVAFDGTGYGPDGSIWGGEFLISTFKSFKRAAHLEYLPMPGGDKAVAEPWRMAAAYLQNSFGDKFLDLKIPFVRRLNKDDWHKLKYAVERKINSPLTSSVGRLFDAVSSIILCIFKVNFEAEAAIDLQKSAQEAFGEKGRYKNNVIRRKGIYVIDVKEMIRGIVRDIEDGIGPPIIAARFHNSISNIILTVCRSLRRESGIKRVAFGGGVFQNRLLFKKALALLNHSGFDLYTHRAFPATDAGISVGQAAIALASPVRPSNITKRSNGARN